MGMPRKVPHLLCWLTLSVVLPARLVHLTQSCGLLHAGSGDASDGGKISTARSRFARGVVGDPGGANPTFSWYRARAAAGGVRGVAGRLKLRGGGAELSEQEELEKARQLLTKATQGFCAAVRDSLLAHAPLLQRSPLPSRRTNDI